MLSCVQVILGWQPMGGGYVQRVVTHKLRTTTSLPGVVRETHVGAYQISCPHASDICAMALFLPALQLLKHPLEGLRVCSTTPQKTLERCMLAVAQHCGKVPAISRPLHEAQNEHVHIEPTTYNAQEALQYGCLKYTSETHQRLLHICLQQLASGLSRN